MKEHMMCMSAAALYDGGWRAEDAEDIQREYGLDYFDLVEIVAWLKDMEERK